MKNLLKRYLVLLIMSCFTVSVSARQPERVIYAGKDARFMIISDGVIRMEWDPSGKFCDKASFVAVHNQPSEEVPVDFSVRKSGGHLIISTPKMVLRYRIGSGRFTADNLKISSPKGFFKYDWHYGKKQNANLKGTCRTLDEFDGMDHRNGVDRLELEDGLLARDGWTVIDESGSLLFDDTEWAWVEERENKEAQDLYFMAYGDDYKAALKDFTLFAGRVPLPPRYAFGYWWSRYWYYSDKEIRDVVRNFQAHHVPLDVFVVDMDWHPIADHSKKDETGEMLKWTGWSWNRSLFPAPEKLLGWMHDQNLKVTLNLHPASGIAPFEDCYEDFAKAVGFDTTGQHYIRYVGSDKRFMSALFDVALRPLERQGVDFWWLDWQQRLNDRKIPALSNTWWLNYTFFSDMERNRSTRPMLYHRWGGLGNHRYQIGFSGDAIISWKSLDFQPYFTSCASNVLYGYWSHDLGGHKFMQGQPRILDPELYTRWLQYGVFSPIFRTHSSKTPSLNKEIWQFSGEYYKAQQEAIRLRYTLVPYIYTAARETYDSGVSICRPMYYDYPKDEEAYAMKNQFMFGDNLLVMPITSPRKGGFSTVKVWLPEGGDWFEWHTGTLLEGGMTYERRFALDEYPVYVKAGSIIPMYGKEVMSLKEQPEEIILAVFPSRSSRNCEGGLYEDNGDDKNYKDQFAFTSFHSCWENDHCLTIKVDARTGSYAGMLPTRKYRIQIYGSAIPAEVTVNGQKCDDWTYSGAELCLNIDTGQSNCNEAREIRVTYPECNVVLTDGLKSRFKRLSQALIDVKYAKAGVILPDEVSSAAETSIAIEYYPDRFVELIERFNTSYGQMDTLIDGAHLSPEVKAKFMEYIQE